MLALQVRVRCGAPAQHESAAAGLEALLPQRKGGAAASSSPPRPESGFRVESSAASARSCTLAAHGRECGNKQRRERLSVLCVLHRAQECRRLQMERTRRTRPEQALACREPRARGSVLLLGGHVYAGKRGARHEACSLMRGSCRPTCAQRRPCQSPLLTPCRRPHSLRSCRCFTSCHSPTSGQRLSLFTSHPVCSSIHAVTHCVRSPQSTCF